MADGVRERQAEEDGFLSQVVFPFCTKGGESSSPHGSPKGSDYYVLLFFYFILVTLVRILYGRDYILTCRVHLLYFMADCIAFTSAFLHV